MKDERIAELRRLASDLVRETLHGPPPVTTTMDLAGGVLELLCEVERLQSFASEVAEVLSEFGNGTTDEEIKQLTYLAFSIAPDWQAEHASRASHERRRDSAKPVRLRAEGAHVGPAVPPVAVRRKSD